MQPDRFTTLAQQALATAQSTAQSRSNGMLEPLHLLVAILEDAGGIGGSIIQRAGGRVDLLRDVARRRLDGLPRRSGGQPATSSGFMQVLQRAEEEARSLGDGIVSTEHLLLALAEVRGDARTALESV